MKFYRFQLSLVFCLVLVTSLASCSPIFGSSGQEIENAPGAYTFTEGTTSYPQLYRQAVRHLQQGEYTEAEAVYGDLIEKEPENSNGYIGLGASLNLQGRYAEAREAYLEALEIAPDSVEALIGLGSAFLMQGEYEKAKQQYTRALELALEDPNAHWGLALALERLGETEAASEHLEKVIELSPGTDLAESAHTLLQDLGMKSE
ncbi:MAG: tetratricopeptide repeat protein [Anaerolineales bacterium]